jgi:ribosome biogenesis GTPase
LSEDAFLSDYGWNAWFESHRSRLLSHQHPARVVAEHRDAWLLATTAGEQLARLAGRLRHAATSRLDLPATGDWIAARLPADGGDARIEAVLPRSSRLVRKVAGDTSEPQIVAANVDLVVIVAALDHDFNPRRLERHAAAVAEGGGLPMVLLNKADLCTDVASFVTAARRAMPDAPILVASAVDGRGLAELRAALRSGLTAALVGSSGVGKSTVLNNLVGREIHATGEVREHDHRGRHVTTHRELVRLPWGALLVDTPGMRELSPWAEGDASASFSDVDELAAACRFADCAHGSEPGCAVLAAVADGRLDAARLEAWRKLSKELHWLAIRNDARALSEQRRKWKVIHKGARARDRLSSS